jgi:hypothetical protein
MTRKTWARSQRSVILRVAGSLIFASAVFPALALPPSSSQTATDTHDSSLDVAIAAIARAFRTEQASALNSILPAAGKIYISLESVGGGPAGYYGRDQVYFIVNEIFQRIDTVSFDIRQGGSSRAKAKGRMSPIHCIGTWQYRGNDGRTMQCQIHFVLSGNGADWSLVQIREAL